MTAWWNLDTATVERLALSLGHFLWQGALAAIAVAVTLRLTARAQARTRYAVAVGGLAAMVVAPVATFLWLGSASEAGSFPAPELFGASAVGRVSIGASQAADPVDWRRWAVALWFAGVAICSIRVAAGWGLTRHFLRTADEVVPYELETAFRTIAERLRTTQPVRLLLSARTAVPVVVGWLRPAILLPASAVTGLSPAQLRAILAHELAHITRHDFAVNLLQSAVESLLFYHPAVWWLSARIRAERELCCDDRAVAVCGDAALYARALVELEKSRAAAPALALAASGGDLSKRIRRLLGGKADPSDWLEPAAVSVLAVAVLVVAACHSGTAQAQAPGAPPAPAASSGSGIGSGAGGGIGSGAGGGIGSGRATGTLGQILAQDRAMGAALQSRGTRFSMSSRDRTAWVLYRGDSEWVNGSSADEMEARMARRAMKGDLLWFRRGGTAYVTQDKSVLDRIAALFAPMEELGKAQEALGEQQRALGEEQRKLGDRMQQVKVNVPDLTADLERIRRQIQNSASQAELGRLQALIGELQSKVGALQGQAGQQQGEIGRLQGELGARQGALGAQQGEIGRKQGEIAARAQAEVAVIAEDLMQSGRAKPAP